MASKVEICNQALIEVGASTITSLSEGTPEANICSQVYDISSRSVQSAGFWTTCTFLDSLNQLSASPLYGFTYQYQLPTNPEILRIIQVKNEHINDTHYEIHGDKLLADESAISIKYVGFVTDPGLYGQLLTDAIIAKIASSIAFKLTGSASAADRLKRLSRAVTREMLFKDGQQNSPVKLTDDTLTRVR